MKSSRVTLRKKASLIDREGEGRRGNEGEQKKQHDGVVKQHLLKHESASVEVIRNRKRVESGEGGTVAGFKGGLGKYVIGDCATPVEEEITYCQRTERLDYIETK